MQRQLADHERHGAELERQWAQLTDSPRTSRSVPELVGALGATRKYAERLSMELDRTAEVLERTAALADEHGRRRGRTGHPESAADEHQAAERARVYAQRARDQADEWRKLAGPPTQ